MQFLGLNANVFLSWGDIFTLPLAGDKIMELKTRQIGALYRAAAFLLKCAVLWITPQSAVVDGSKIKRNALRRLTPL